MNDEVRKHFINFLNKVLDQSYTRGEWESFSYSFCQDNLLEKTRLEIVNLVSKTIEPKDFKIKTINQETKNSIQKMRDKLDRDIQ